MIAVGSWVQGDTISGLVTGRAFNGICIMLRVQTDLDKTVLIPEPRIAPAAAPQRRGIRLVCQDGVRV